MPSSTSSEYDHLSTSAFNARYQSLADFIKINQGMLESAYAKIHQEFLSSIENNFSDFIKKDNSKVQSEYNKIWGIYERFKDENKKEINKITENIFALNINENDSEESIGSEFSIESVGSIQDTNNIESEEGLESEESINDDSNADRKSFLHKAALEEDLPLIKFLIVTGHDINLQDAQHKTALYDACSQLKIASANILLDLGADPNLGNSHIKYKYISKETHAEQELRGSRVPLVAVIKSTATVTAAKLTVASVTSENFSNLSDEQATKLAAARLVEKLIAKAADVNLKTGQHEFAALHRAVAKRKLLIIKEIIKSGKANFELVDRGGETALHMVADYRTSDDKEHEQLEMQEEKEIAELLVQHVEALDKKEHLGGNTPLHTAVIRSNLDVVKAIYKEDYRFFSHQKILSIQNKDGNTPIHEAIKEAQRGPKILAFLLSVATEDDLNIKNNPVLDANGVAIRNAETAKQMADRLVQEANSVRDLVDKVKIQIMALEQFVDNVHLDADEIDVPEEIAKLKQAIQNLKDSDAFDTKLLNDLSFDDLSNGIEDLFRKLELYKPNTKMSLITADELASSARNRLTDIESLDFYSKNYLDSLENVKQQNYFAWKAEQLRLPSSFPDLETVESNLLNPPMPMESIFHRADAWYVDGVNKYDNRAYQDAISSLEESIRLFNPHYSRHRSLAYAHTMLARAYLADNDNNVAPQTKLAEDNNLKARVNLEKSIEIYHTLKEYHPLEQDYQTLAKTYIKDDYSIARFEETNRKKLSLDNQEQLQGHLALAGLYKQLGEQAFASTSFSIQDLWIRESYHYHQAYKLTQGKLDNSAYVVLQREIGIANDESLGTYNIQQCVAVVAFDPVTKKLVLSHFDKASGPASFIEQLANEFPGRAPIDLYISGGRDRVTPAVTTIPSKISDNNIDFVLKQIHLKNSEDSVDGNPENGRFKIKACDVGDKLSPEGIVFDVQSQRLVHATPNRADTSNEPRAVYFLLQKSKADYVCPLNPVDFTKSETERTISFSPAEQQQIRDKTAEYTQYYSYGTEGKTWQHDQLLYPLMTVNNEIDRVTRQDFDQGLLTDYLTRYRNSLYGAPLIANTLQVAEDDDENFNRWLQCLGNRRRREAGLCTLDSEHLLEGMGKLSESKQAEFLEQVSKRKVGGAKQEEIATLVHNQETTNHLKKAGSISAKLMDGLFYDDAIMGLSKGDPSLAIQLGGFKALSYGLEKASARMDVTGLDLIAEGKTIQGNLFRAGGPFVRRGTSILIAFDLYKQASELQKNSNNTDALVGVVSDGIQIGTDLGTGAIEVAEITSERIALMGISEITGPVGEAVVGIVILGERIYEDVEKVDQENHLVHLTVLERIEEGGLAFAGLESQTYLKKMFDEVNEYNRILPKRSEFLKNHPEVKYIIFPAIEKTNPNCNGVREEESCTAGGPLFPSRCTTKKTGCDPIFAEIENNSVDLSAPRSGFKVTREKIVAPSGSQLLCVPTAEDGDELTTQAAFFCENAIGLGRSGTNNGTIALFQLGVGMDGVIGFPELVNAFMINNGAKYYRGGKKDDQFFLQATEVSSAIDANTLTLERGLDGAEGSDSLLLQVFKPSADKIIVNLANGYLRYNNKTLAITRIEKLFGGAVPLAITAACDTQEIHLRNGAMVQSNTLLIPQSSCAYGFETYLQAPVTLSANIEAEAGNFPHYILSGKGNMAVNLTAEGKSQVQQEIIFNVPISDVVSIQASMTSTALNLTLNTDDKAEAFKFELQTNLFNSTRFYFMDAELRVGYKNLYLFPITGKPNPSTAEIMDKYAPIASRLNLICSLMTGNNEQILIGNNGHEIMHNNPKALRTHLNSNGGEGVFVIQSGMPSLRLSHLPIPEVVMYRRLEDTHIDTLDFRPLVKQIQASNSTAKLVIIPPNAQNHLADDLLLLLGIVAAPNSPRLIEVATVRLKDARLDHWYKQYLHILLNDNLPQQIAGRHAHLYLKPIPLEFDAQHEIASVGVNDVEENTDVIIPRAYEADAFFHHNKTNLVWTNRLSNRTKDVEPFTLILNKFFQEPKLQTLALQFTDEKIVLNNKLTELKAVEDFESVKNAHLAGLRAESLSIINSQQLLPKAAQNLTEANIGQDHYSSNDINATSIESEEHSLETKDKTHRSRRSVQWLTVNPNSISSRGLFSTKTKKQANDNSELSDFNAIKPTEDSAPANNRTPGNFYANLKKKRDIEKQKRSQQNFQDNNGEALKHTKGKKAKNELLPSIATQQTEDSASKHKKGQTLSKQTSQNIFQDHERNNKANSPRYVVINHNKFEATQHSTPSLNIGNQSGKYLHSQVGNTQNSYQHAHQHSEKSSLSYVNAPGDTQGLIWLAHLFVRIKPQVPLKSKTSNWKEKVDREIRNVRTTHIK